MTNMNLTIFLDIISNHLTILVRSSNYTAMHFFDSASVCRRLLISDVYLCEIGELHSNNLFYFLGD